LLFTINGLYKGASVYSDRDEVVKDILHLVRKTSELLHKYFKDKRDEELEGLYKKVEELLNKFLK